MSMIQTIKHQNKQLVGMQIVQGQQIVYINPKCANEMADLELFVKFYCSV